MPGVITPMMVKRPMMPKMNAPSRMRIGHGGRSAPRRRELPNATDALASEDGVVGSPARAPRLRAARRSRRRRRSTPPSKSPALNCGVITLRMIRLADRVGAACPRGRSRPRCASCGPSARRRRARRCPCPSGRASTASNTRFAYSSMLSPPIVGTVSTTIWLVVLSSCAFERRRQPLARRGRQDLRVVDDAAGQVRHVGRERRRREHDAASSAQRASARIVMRPALLDRPVGERVAVAARDALAGEQLADRGEPREQRLARSAPARSASVIRAMTASHSATRDARRAVRCRPGSTTRRSSRLTSTRIAVRSRVANSSRSRNCTFAYCATSSAARESRRNSRAKPGT